MISWATIEDAIYAWVSTASALPVIWSEGGGPRPDGAYIALSASVQSVGQGWTKYTDNPAMPENLVLYSTDASQWTGTGSLVDGPEGDTGEGKVTNSFNSTIGLGAVGIPLAAGTEYTLSFYARCTSDTASNLNIEVRHPTSFINEVSAIVATTDEWARYELAFTPAESVAYTFHVNRNDPEGHETARPQLNRGSEAAEFIETEGVVVVASGQECVETRYQVKILTLDMQCFDGAATGISSPVSVLDDVLDKSNLAVYRDPLLAVGWAPGIAGAVQKISGVIGGTIFEPRALVQCTGMISATVAGTSTYIQIAEVENLLTGETAVLNTGMSGSIAASATLTAILSGDYVLAGDIVASALAEAGALVYTNLSGEVLASASLAAALVVEYVLSGAVNTAATATGDLQPGGPTTLADFDFRAPLPSWTAGRTGFSSAFATDEWLMQDAASPLANNIASETLTNDSGLVDRTCVPVYDGTAYGNRKCWEATAATDSLYASGTTAGDSDNVDVSARIVFAMPVQSNGNYLLSKRTAGAGLPGWYIKVATNGRATVTLDDGPNTVTVNGSANINCGDGALHAVSFWYDESAKIVYINVDGEETSGSVSIITGSLTNTHALSVNDYAAPGGGLGLAKVQVAYVGVCVGANAASMYAETFWQHAQDPSGLLTTTSRSTPIKVPVTSTGLTSTFAGGTTVGTTQLPIGYDSGLVAGTGGYGLFCNSAVTNLVPYSRVSTGATNSNVAATDNASDASDGFRAASTLAATTPNGYQARVCTTVASTSYMAAVRIKEVTVGVTGRVIMYDETNAAELGSTIFTATSSWQDVVVRASTIAGGISTSVRVEVDTSGETVAVDDWQLNLAGTVATKRGATIYTNGSAAALVASQYSATGNLVQESAGELHVTAVWNEDPAGKYLYGTELSDQKQVLILLSNGRAQSTLRNAASTVEYSVTDDDQHTPGTELSHHLIWDESASGVDGFKVVVFDADHNTRNNGVVSPWSGASGGGYLPEFFVGQSSAGANQLDGYIGRIVSYDALNVVLP